jgi:hypothetical protein
MENSIMTRIACQYRLYFIVLLILSSGCALTQQPVQPVEMPRGEGDCHYPASEVGITSMEVKVAATNLKAFSLGSFEYSAHPEVLSAMAKAGRSQLVTSYLMCVAKYRGDIDFHDTEEVSRLRNFLEFMSTGPSPEQVIKWHQEFPPKGHSGAIHQQFHTGSGDNVRGDKTIVNQRTRPLYSATQIINNLSLSSGVLNLDNLATLTLSPPIRAGKITLVLDAVLLGEPKGQTAPVEAAPPTVEELPDGNLRADVSERLQFEDSASAFSSHPEQEYVFDLDDNKRREISVGGRTFIVTLKAIRPLRGKGDNAVEYEFGVSESAR